MKRFAEGERPGGAKADTCGGRGLDSGKAEVKTWEKPKS